MDGLLLINKLPGPTSHDVVQLIRRKLSQQRVGHTGTLDPAAQGLLILLIGSATKQQRTFQRHPKLYEASLRLGIRTDTGDADGRAIQDAPVPPLDREQIRRVLGTFQGSVSQTPPAFSAVKVHGRPAYWWARRRREVVLPARVVEIASIELMQWEGPTITFRVDCSAGTYIRSLGESIAERLGTVGHLTALTRLRIGSWTLEQAVPLAWIRQAKPHDVMTRVLAL